METWDFYDLEIGNILRPIKDIPCYFKVIDILSEHKVYVMSYDTFNDEMFISFPLIYSYEYLSKNMRLEKGYINDYDDSGVI